ncbi:putative metal-dependent hydrolase YjjV [Thalassotalea loyana]|uniref:Metal-dependent hydrolase YjjV n=1 Tax=Thalassotalea loyana TaxID=280483 RepID=A0ABQ6HDZ3_9GAMM|nr:TatD family hydrolase [Thalassotalea loyana]GLX84970.1 putative metal-dependent hydrolase YjjV [Thalassotalea loyana]
MLFTDSHCHFDFKEFAQTREAVAKNCLDLGVHQLIVPAIAPSNWQAVLALETQSELKLHKALGIHPWFLNDLTLADVEDLSSLVTRHHSEIIAIGEIGIDGKIAEDYDNLTKQIQFFDAQLALAAKSQLPVIVHHRKSHPLLVERIKSAKYSGGGIVHAFSGSFQQAKHYLDLGFKLGIGGTITYERAAKTRKTVTKLPLESMVLETDAPAMPIFQQKIQHNSPENIPLIFDALTDLRQEPKDLIAEQLENNIINLFSA